MTYFADLTPHTYTPTKSLNVLNIGWLDEGMPFTTGRASEEFRTSLRELCEHCILLHRGFHPCWFCKKRDPSGGNGQIRVLSKAGIWYAAPTLICHYVCDHEYCPPSEFIEAVLSPVAIGTNFGWHPRSED